MLFVTTIFIVICVLFVCRVILCVPPMMLTMIIRIIIIIGRLPKQQLEWNAQAIHLSQQQKKEKKNQNQIYRKLRHLLWNHRPMRAITYWSN